MTEDPKSRRNNERQFSPNGGNKASDLKAWSKLKRQKEKTNQKRKTPVDTYASGLILSGFAYVNCFGVAAYAFPGPSLSREKPGVSRCCNIDFLFEITVACRLGFLPRLIFRKGRKTFVLKPFGLTKVCNPRRLGFPPQRIYREGRKAFVNSLIFTQHKALRAFSDWKIETRYVTRV